MLGGVGKCREGQYVGKTLSGAGIQGKSEKEVKHMKELVPGARVKMLFSGRAGQVTGRCDCTACMSNKSSYLYKILLDGDDHPTLIGNTEIAPESHGIHQVIADWKAEMKRAGFRSIIVGKDSNGRLHSVFFNGQENYNKAKASIDNVTWLNYWALRD